MFDLALDVMQDNACVMESKDTGSPHTIIVLGEFHSVPYVQRDLLYTLSLLHDQLKFSLLGVEGRRTQFRIAQRCMIDYEGAVQDDYYMNELLRNKIDASTIFAKMHDQDVVAKVVDDPLLRLFALKINKRLRRLFVLKQRAGADGLTEEQKLEYDYWLNLMKQITLRDRSNIMVRNIYRQQKKLDKALSVLVCGLAHTPSQAENVEFSVAPFLKQLPVNFIIGAPKVAWQYHQNTRGKRDPFDFFTPFDWEDIKDVDPYRSTVETTCS